MDRNGRALIVGLLVLAVAMATGLAWLLTRAIVVPLTTAMAFTDAIASGDLTRGAHAEGRDEFARLIRSLASMRDKLVRMVGGMRNSSDSIATASA